MLTVTEPAMARLNEMLGDRMPESAVRIFVRAGRLKMRRDKPRVGDTIYGNGRRSLLVIGRHISRRLSTMILKIRPTKNGPRLRLYSPQPDCPNA